MIWASERGHIDVIKMLLATPSIDLNAADEVRRDEHAACDNAPPQKLCFYSQDGHTAAYFAARERKPEVLCLLANAGADVNIPSKVRRHVVATRLQRFVHCPSE